MKKRGRQGNANGTKGPIKQQEGQMVGQTHRKNTFGSTVALDILSLKAKASIQGAIETKYD